MTPEKRAQKFHTDYPMQRYPDLVVSREEFPSANQKHYPDLGSDTSSVLYFCARSPRRHFAGKPAVAAAKCLRLVPVGKSGYSLSLLDDMT